MKGLRFERYGPPSVLSLEDLPMPELKAGQALVEIHAAAINPSDVKNLAGAFHADLPRTPGRDYAGVVVSGDPWVGKQVWGSGTGLGVVRDGTHAQFLVADLDSLSEKPSRLSMEEAASVGIPYLTAWTALVDAAAIQEGETVLIIGVNGAVGRAATQIAHWRKAKVIGVAHSEHPSEADFTINPSSQDIAAEVKAITHGIGADLALDAVGGSMFERSLRSLRQGGRQVAITSAGSPRVEFNLIDFYHNLTHLIGVDSMKLSGPEIAQLMDKLREGFDDGQFMPSSVQNWRLDQAREAYAAVQQGGSSKKQVLVPGGT